MKTFTVALTMNSLTRMRAQVEAPDEQTAAIIACETPEKFIWNSGLTPENDNLSFATVQEDGSEIEATRTTGKA